MIEIVLKFHEIDWIYALVTIAARKNNVTVPKLKSLFQEMQRLDKPVCKIVVEDKHSDKTTVLEFLKECKINDWDLDSEDIEHIISGEFDFVRDSNTTIPDKEAKKILGEES